ncbi:hypothetical protein KW837_21535 [Pseudomonas sp. PDM24]|jgi:hypothetical protein|uniref:hypothetical protein n=1 Tax=Pseudomonas sp. PDM24 TaxID=2854777 RepID=UPI001C484F15|nr:hypothetical protein [Pseudomonas sp. PDM24]MBV7496855.1 hypothetical protein [Pseudomonas sp. PDM24]
MSAPEDYNSLKAKGEKVIGTMSAFLNDTQILDTKTITYVRGNEVYMFFGESDDQSRVILSFPEALDPSEIHTVRYPEDLEGLNSSWQAADKDLPLPVKKGSMQLKFFDSGKRSFEGTFDIDLEGDLGKLTGKFHIPKQK